MPNRFLRAAVLAALFVFGVSTAFAHGGRHHVRHHHGHFRHRAVHGHRKGGNRVLGISRSLPVVAPDLVAEAERFLGSRNPTGFRGEWCGAFLGLVAHRVGRFVPDGFRLAARWISAGPRLPGPAIGALAVYSHHVGIVAGMTARGPLLISGNWNRRVAEGVQRRGRFLGYVALRR